MVVGDSSVYSIKLYGWENSFLRRVLEVRNEQELKMLKKIGIVTVTHPYPSFGELLCSTSHRPEIWLSGLVSRYWWRLPLLLLQLLFLLDL